MSKLYFRYGYSKSAAICQIAYNYNERGMEVAIINAKNNEKIKSKLANLERDVNVILDGNSLYNKIDLKKISAVLVDNAQYLSQTLIEELFYIAKLENIPVIAFGERISQEETNGAIRLMELADTIESIDKVNNRGNGSLEYYYGAMNCSKTANLLYKNEHLIEDGNITLLIKPKLDRDEKLIQSRIGLEKEADIIADENTPLYATLKYKIEHDYVNYILVDETQFLTESQIDQLKRISEEYKVSVICYGLKTDFLSHAFTGSKRLLEVADTITKMRTVCRCGKGADFNVRIDKNGNYVKEGEQLVIDDGVTYTYVSVCANCFIKNVLGNPQITRVKK